MGKWGAYLITVGTEPGVYDSWYEAADRVMNVRGAIYKGYPTKWEAQEAFRNALAQGRVRAVRTDRELASPAIQVVTAPPALQTRNAGYPRTTNAQLVRPPASTASYRASRTSPLSSSPAVKTEPGLSRAPAPTKPESSRRAAVSTKPMPLPPSRSPSSSSSPVKKIEPGIARTASFSPRSASQPIPASRHTSRPPSTSSSPTTGVTHVEPGLTPPSTPRSAWHVVSPSSGVSYLSSRTQSTSSSPTTGVTHIEPGLSSMGTSSASSPAIPTSSRQRITRSRTFDAQVQTDTPRATPRRITRSHTFDAQVQTDTPPQSPSPSSPATSRHAERCPKCHRLKRAAPGSPSSMRSGFTSGYRLQPQSPELEPLTGLGLSQPMRALNVAYDAGEDPRSPMHRATPVPASVPVFNRPSPQMSIESVLFGR